jgi:hypothetical protein
MLDHTGFAVSGFQHKQDFLQKLLAPLGITILMEPRERQPALARTAGPFFWIEDRPPAAAYDQVVGTSDVALLVAGWRGGRTLSTLSPNGTPTRRQNAMSSTAVATA